MEVELLVCCAICLRACYAMPSGGGPEERGADGPAERGRGVTRSQYPTLHSAPILAPRIAQCDVAQSDSVAAVLLRAGYAIPVLR
eukprot:3328167-Rhodomonas_salina.3